MLRLFGAVHKQFPWLGVKLLVELLAVVLLVGASTVVFRVNHLVDRLQKELIDGNEIHIEEFKIPKRGRT